MKDTKICPICVAGENNFVNYCIRQDCAWWADYADDCSIPVIAGILADSNICQNVWKKPPKEDEA